MGRDRAVKMSRFRGRLQSSLGWLDGVAALIAAGGVLLQAIPGISWAATLAVVAAAAVLELLARLRRWLAARHSLLYNGRPCAVDDVNPFDDEVGVFQSATAAQYAKPGGIPPYVPRGDSGSIDRRIDEVLRVERFVLITGTSTAGKTRTAFEAVRRMEPPPKLLIPASPEALAQLFALEPPLRLKHGPYVLWLDGLDRYLSVSGVTRKTIEAFLTKIPDVTIIATITVTELTRSSLGPVGGARGVLSMARERNAEIALPDAPTASEVEVAAELYPGESVTAGLGEHFVGPQELVALLRAGMQEEPDGFAIVVAALDWRRAGLIRPITRDDLWALYRDYLDFYYPLAEVAPDSFERGLQWATRPLRTRAALLMPYSDDNKVGFAIFDAVRDWVDAALIASLVPSEDQGRADGWSSGADVDPRLIQVRPSVWSYVIPRAEPAEQFSIGFAAYTRGASEPAEEAWRAVVASASSDVSAVAALSLGMILRETQWQEAEHFLRLAADVKSVPLSPRASYYLGGLLAHHGKPIEAEREYRRALEGGDADWALLAAFALRDLLNTQDSPAEAITNLVDPETTHPIERAIASRAEGPDISPRVRAALTASTVATLGSGAGTMIGPSQFTETNLLTFTADDADGRELTFIPAFTRPACIEEAVFRTPYWGLLSVLLNDGGELLHALDGAPGEVLIIDPWVAGLEFRIDLSPTPAQE